MYKINLDKDERHSKKKKNVNKRKGASIIRFLYAYGKTANVVPKQLTEERKSQSMVISFRLWERYSVTDGLFLNSIITDDPGDKG